MEATLEIYNNNNNNIHMQLHWMWHVLILVQLTKEEKRYPHNLLKKMVKN